MKPARWSDPYCGIQHLRGVREGFQITITHHERFSGAQIWDCGRPFSGLNEEHDIFKAGAMLVEADWPQSEDPPAAIRAWAEKRARELGLLSL